MKQFSWKEVRIVILIRVVRVVVFGVIRGRSSSGGVGDVIVANGLEMLPFLIDESCSCGGGGGSCGCCRLLSRRSSNSSTAAANASATTTTARLTAGTGSRGNGSGRRLHHARSGGGEEGLVAFSLQLLVRVGEEAEAKFAAGIVSFVSLLFVSLLSVHQCHRFIFSSSSCIIIFTEKEDEKLAPKQFHQLFFQIDLLFLKI